MRKTPEGTSKKQPGTSKKLTASATDDTIHHLAFDNSIQPNIITTVSSGKIIIANSAACKLLGYSKKELITKDRLAIFNINERGFKKMLKQRTAEGHFIALVTAIKKSGKLIPCEITSAVFMDKTGIEKSVITISDLSESILKQKNIDIKKEKIVADNIVLAKSRSDKEKLDLENNARKKLLAEIEKNFRTMFNASSEVLFDSDLVANKVTINDSYEKEFGYKKNDTMAPAEDWLNHIHPDDKEAVMRDYFRMLVSSEMEWKYSFRFLRADQSVVDVLSKGIVLRRSDGTAYRRIGYLIDISKQKILEERLDQEIKLKEIQIAEATKDAKETERSDIGKELHDNVNQLLGASRMCLEMAKRGGENSGMYLSRSSEYTLAAIDEIRKLTKGLTTDTIKNIGLCDAIDNLARDTMETNKLKIFCELDSFKENSVNDKFKLNVYRIVQEELNNILKHARARYVTISLLQNKKFIVLSVSDNGVGFDTGKKRMGIGVANIKSRAASYNGTADFVSQPGQGCVLTATFPFADMLTNKN